MAAGVRIDHTRPMQFHIAEVYWGRDRGGRDKEKREKGEKDRKHLPFI